MAGLSDRAIQNVNGPDLWEPLVKALKAAWTPGNNGIIPLSLAENHLMRKEVEQHIQEDFLVTASKHFSYGEGPQGSPVLRTALSEYFNSTLRPIKPTKPDNFLITAGVSALTDHLSWTICNEGEGILLPRPFYAGFMQDISTRARARVVPVSFEREDGQIVLDDVFDTQANSRCLEKALRESEAAGVKIRAVMITNPHNPLGKCYPPETLLAIARFCSKHNLHYLSDEIYAQSTFPNPNHPDVAPFHSVLSITGLCDGSAIDPQHVHVLYGASKDFGANGLRLATLYSRNETLLRAVRSISVFSWPSYLVQDTWARLLTPTFLTTYLPTNRTRLQSNYTQLTQALTTLSIPYFPSGNAGLFLWVDLRAYLPSSPCAAGADYTFTQAALCTDPVRNRVFAQARASQDRLAGLLVDAGVAVSKGEGYGSEEFGWFRVVFSLPEEVLGLGIERLERGLTRAREVES